MEDETEHAPHVPNWCLHHYQDNLIATEVFAVIDLIRSITTTLSTEDKYQFEGQIYNFVRDFPTIEALLGSLSHGQYLAFAFCDLSWRGPKGHLNIAMSRKRRTVKFAVAGPRRDGQTPACAQVVFPRGFYDHNISIRLLHLTALIARDNFACMTYDNRKWNCGRNHSLRSPTFPEMLQAFGKAGFWKEKVRVITLKAHPRSRLECDDDWHLEVYPQALEQICDLAIPPDSSKHYLTLACRVSNFKSWNVFGVPESETSRQLQARRMPEKLLEDLCDVLSNDNTLCCMPFVNVAMSPVEQFEQIVQAVTFRHSRPSKPKYKRLPTFRRGGCHTRQLREERQRVDNKRGEILGRREDWFRFYIGLNRYRAFFSSCSGTSKIAAHVLAHCHVQRAEENNAFGKSRMFAILRECSGHWLPHWLKGPATGDRAIGDKDTTNDEATLQSPTNKIRRGTK